MGIAIFVLIILTGLALVVSLYNGGRMDTLNQAVARVQDSMQKAIAKIDSLKSTQGINPADLQPVVDTLNQVADVLDQKTA